MRLTDLVTKETVLLDLRAGTKPELLAELAGRASFLTRLDRMNIFRELLDHETRASSGLGLGVAMPHARFKELNTPVALFAKLSRPIDYHALDKRPVDMLFLLLGPDPATASYLNLLLSASRALRDPATREALREHFAPATIVAALHDNLIPVPH
jgi:PTS system nitrogen regulatory IIA component